MEKAIKGLIGGYKVTTENSTHVVLEVDEFNAYLRENDDLKTDLRNCKLEMEKQAQIANMKLKQGYESFESTKNDYEENLRQKDAEIERLNSLNENLLRISRERANAKRGLKPKKQHHGYMLLDEAQYLWQRRFAKSTFKTNAWKIQIQSPYDATIPFETIVKDIHNDLLSVFGRSLGVSSAYGNEYINSIDYSKLKEEFDSEERFIFQTSYKRNFKSGFWEIIYLANTSITPDETMFAQ